MSEPHLQSVSERLIIKVNAMSNSAKAVPSTRGTTAGGKGWSRRRRRSAASVQCGLCARFRAVRSVDPVQKYSACGVPKLRPAGFLHPQGATLPPHSITTEPSAHIFDWTLIISGLILIVGAICFHQPIIEGCSASRQCSKALVCSASACSPATITTFTERSRWPPSCSAASPRRSPGRSPRHPFATSASCWGDVAVLPRRGHRPVRGNLGCRRSGTFGLSDRVVDGHVRRIHDGRPVAATRVLRSSRPVRGPSSAPGRTTLRVETRDPGSLIEDVEELVDLPDGVEEMG
jgi:hypothetical protein